MANVSIIVRTKNEERWIGHCLEMIYLQDYKDFEVILVDNNSTDHTVEVAKRYPLAAIINIDKFLPGRALNDGIRASSGKFIVCLSAHCVPKNADWLSTLLKNFDNDEKLAGVYGRQLPTAFTDPVDKRDLLIVFGQDRRVQIKDYFFHNANSMLKRSVWDKFPFDEEVTNIEDRVWGKAVTNAGYHIVYDPEASVFHYHGLHQGNAPKRAQGVVSIIEKIDADVFNELPISWLPENTNVIAICPIIEEVEIDSFSFKLLAETIASLKKAKFVKSIYLVSRQPSLAEVLKVENLNRDKINDADKLGLDELMQKILKLIEDDKKYPDSLLYVNYDYIRRPEGLFDQLIQDAQYKGCDTVFPGFMDYNHYWLKTNDGDYIQTDSSMKARSERNPVFRALYGQGCLTSAVQIRSGKLIGGKIGILPVNDSTFTKRLAHEDSIK
jgi:rhamnosyltransferase